MECVHNRVKMFDSSPLKYLFNASLIREVIYIGALREASLSVDMQNANKLYIIIYSNEIKNDNGALLFTDSPRVKR